MSLPLGFSDVPVSILDASSSASFSNADSRERFPRCSASLTDFDSLAVFFSFLWEVWMVGFCSSSVLASISTTGDFSTSKVAASCSGTVSGNAATTIDSILTWPSL